MSVSCEATARLPSVGTAQTPCRVSNETALELLYSLKLQAHFPETVPLVCLENLSVSIV